MENNKPYIHNLNYKLIIDNYLHSYAQQNYSLATSGKFMRLRSNLSTIKQKLHDKKNEMQENRMEKKLQKQKESQSEPQLEKDKQIQTEKKSLKTKGKDSFENLKNYYKLKKQKVVANASDYKANYTHKVKHFFDIRNNRKENKILAKWTIICIYFSTNAIFFYMKFMTKNSLKINHVYFMVGTTSAFVLLNVYTQLKINAYYRGKVKGLVLNNNEIK